MSELVGGSSAPRSLAESSQDQPGTRALILLTFFVLFFYSFVLVSQVQPLFHVGFNERWMTMAAVPACLTAAIGVAFVFARFSFGYLVGFYLFVMMAGYFWLNTFSLLNYDHNQALFAATSSIVLFLLPALMIRADAPRPRLPAKMLNQTPDVILALSALVLVWCALDGFRLVGFGEMEKYRTTLAVARGRALEYAIGNVNGALIPFAIALAFLAGRKWMVVALCIVSLLFYPVTLTKTAIFTGPFIVFMAAISSRFEPRIAAILSLMIPMLIGLGTVAGISWEAMDNARFMVFGTLNFRLLSIPSISLEHYFEFFHNNPQTYFCQVSVFKSWMACPYTDQLGVVLAKEYRIGNMNASLFATEGVASVGLLWMPLSAFACGAVIAAANLASARLPARFILISGAIIPHTLLNVPLSTTLLSNGLALLIALWYLTPREYFSEPNPS